MENEQPEQVVISVGDFPDKLKELRKKKGLTQEQLAQELNVKQQTVSGLENGKIEPSLKVLGALAAILGVALIIGLILKGGKGNE